MKKINYIFIALIAFAMFTIKVDAASVGLKKNHNSITKGGYVTVSATVSSDSPIVSIEGTLSCTGAGSSTVSMVFDDMSNSLYSKTFSTTVKGNSIGTITCTASGVRITSMASSDWQYLGNQSTTIAVTAPRTYSSNNNLTGLSVDGYTLSPTFSSNTLEYSIEVPNEVRKININATKEDNTASIYGSGERDLIEGVNRVEVAVTAENGATKTYIITVTVKELDPIIVNVDNQEYTVVRKKEQITIPNETFVEATAKINDFEVPAFKNEKVGYTLVGLKDSTGNIALYIYDEKNNAYTLYKEYKFKSSIICIIDDESKIPEGYIKSKVKINEREVTAYKINNASKYYLLYGTNLETGKNNLYIFDSEENTIQRYNDEKSNANVTEKEEIYQYIIIGLGSLLIITYLVLLISLISNSRKKKIARMKKMSKNNIEDIEDKQIEKIEEHDNSKDNKAEERDPLYNDIIEFASSNKKITISTIQKKFKINYDRAKKIIEDLKKDEIIGHSKKNDLKNSTNVNNDEQNQEEQGIKGKN